MANTKMLSSDHRNHLQGFIQVANRSRESIRNRWNPLDVTTSQMRMRINLDFFKVFLLLCHCQITIQTSCGIRFLLYPTSLNKAKIIAYLRGYLLMIHVHLKWRTNEQLFTGWALGSIVEPIRMKVWFIWLICFSCRFQDLHLSWLVNLPP